MNCAHGAPAVSGAAPLVFEAPAGWCFGWFHRAQGARRRAGVVLCRPMGYEALCSYRNYTKLAQVLAQAGFDVLRFDYHGTGDSSGDDADPDRVTAWLDSITAATAQLRRLAAIEQVSLFGVRLGATLAVRAAAQMGGVADLVLWAPCATGKAFAREMRAAGASRGFVAPANKSGGIEGLGCLYTAQTLEQLNALNFADLQAAPAPRALVIDRDDLPGDPALPKKFRALGMEVAQHQWPGYAGMMAEPHEATLHPSTLESIAQWLAAAHPVAVPCDDPAPDVGWPEQHAVGLVRESVHRFGPDAALTGVLAQTAGWAGDTAVLMLNVGGNYRIGPNRVYVRAARALATAGYCVLRFDLPGVGDSRVDAEFSSGSMYTQKTTPDVQAAIDFLASRGCKRFYLMGICSGAYCAFQTALADPRVTGQVLLNSRLLEWDAARSGNWQNSMQRYYKSTDHYRRALWKAQLYWRLLRGEVNVSGIAGRFWDLFVARAARAIAVVTGRATEHEGVLNKFKRLSARGCDTLVIMSAQDDGLDYVEFHLGRRGSRMRGHANFRMVMVEDADHTFSTQSAQHVVIETIRKHLDQQLESDPRWSTLPRVATT